MQTPRRQSIRRALSGIPVCDAVPARASVASRQTRDLFRRECAPFVGARGVACCVATSHLLSCCRLQLLSPYVDLWVVQFIKRQGLLTRCWVANCSFCIVGLNQSVWGCAGESHCFRQSPLRRQMLPVRVMRKGVLAAFLVSRSKPDVMLALRAASLRCVLRSDLHMRKATSESSGSGGITKLSHMQACRACSDWQVVPHVFLFLRFTSLQFCTCFQGFPVLKLYGRMWPIPTSGSNFAFGLFPGACITVLAQPTLTITVRAH